MWCIKEGGTSFKVRTMNNIIYQKIVIFSFKLKMKHKFLFLKCNEKLLNEYHNDIYEYQQYFQCFVVCIQVTHIC